MIGIYKIENLINGHKYIGQSIRIEERWKDEKSAAFSKNDEAYEYPLSRAMRKYGIENFSFEVIEECLPNELNEKERYWIQYFNSFYNGYNQTLGGNATVAKPKENIIGIIYDLENTDMYHKEIAEKWNVSQETVQGINTGRYWFQENKKYPLQTKHKSKSQHRTIDQDGIVQKKKYYCKKCGEEISKQATYCVQCSKLLSRVVERPTKEELYEYLLSLNGNFSQVGKNFGVTDNAIRKWCKSYGIPSKSAEYKQILNTKK